ncbi:MAG: class I SAM-dependent methyltransferase family protein [Candidatus Thorarchaeota archaeon]
MRFREFLRESLYDSIPDQSDLPTGFHLVGHVALLQLKSSQIDYANLIGETVLEFDSRIKSVAVRAGPTSGIVRSPNYVLVAGESSTITTHIENDVQFRLDPLRITFSGGNKGERIRMSTLIQHNELVVDMFACVGQFALHIAKRTRASVVAIEINPEAYSFLLENIRINKLDKIVRAINGDCRKVHPTQIANRVIMGYLHNTTDYLPYALETLSEKGGIIHMHTTCPLHEVEEICNTVNTICNGYGFSTTIETRRIKHYSPGVEHYVFDINVEPEI